VLAVIILGVACLRLRLLGVPLERDEGEYAYMGQMILRGEVPYADAYNMKFPGVYYSYAVILAIFGQTDVGIHLGLLVINALAIVLLFLLAVRLFDVGTALAAAASFGWLSLSQSVLGFTANAEHFVLVPALAATFVLVWADDSRRSWPLLGAGVLFGLAVQMKQHGAAFAAFGGCYLLAQGRARGRAGWRQSGRDVLLLAAGVLLPFGVTCLYLWWKGSLESFWFWTFTYARYYASMTTWAEGLGNLTWVVRYILEVSALIWVLAGLGLAAVSWDAVARGRARFVKWFTAFSFLAVCPGLHFRDHYFILLLPAAGLLAGLGAVAGGRLWARRVGVHGAAALPVLVTVLGVISAAYREHMYLFVNSPRTVARATYGSQPFPEAADLGAYIRAHSSPEDEVAVIGSEPQIYFYSGRHAATGFMYTYALMEPHPYALQMQEDMIAQIEGAEPRFIVYVDHHSSWCEWPTSHRLIFQWSQRYLQDHYRTARVIKLPRKNYHMTLFERKHPRPPQVLAAGPFGTGRRPLVP
jgi:hypothetical protein